MTTTFKDLVTDVATSLRSYTGVEQLTWLTSSVTASDLSLPVDSPDAAVRGLVEIDDELIYIASSDEASITAAPFGRGYEGTAAASHEMNAAVTLAPIFPKVNVKRKINQTIESLYPTLYGVKTADLTGDAVSIGYELPEDCEDVLKVEWHPLGDITNWWPEIRDYDFDPNSDAFDSGKALTLKSYVDVGAPIRVTYKARPTALSADTDTLDSIGLPDSVADVILYGTTAQMIRFMDTRRLSLTSVENISRAQVVGAGDASKVANSIYAMYQQRLAEERRRLLLQFPPSIKYQE